MFDMPLCVELPGRHASAPAKMSRGAPAAREWSSALPPHPASAAASAAAQTPCPRPQPSPPEPRSTLRPLSRCVLSDRRLVVLPVASNYPRIRFQSIAQRCFGHSQLGVTFNRGRSLTRVFAQRKVELR